MSKVAVTGAGGYIASMLIKSLLSKGYTVHGTVRNLKDEKKVKHLIESIGKSEKGKLVLFEADLLADGSFKNCFEGVESVFHTASPFQLSVKDPQKDLIDPAVNGTKNVINEALNSKTVKKIIVTSSMAAVCGVRKLPHVYTEQDFNDTASLESPYPFSKVSAELKAWELVKEAQKNGSSVELITINPGFVFGPVLSARDDSTSVNFIKGLLTGTVKQIDATSKFSYIDVRDVVDAHIQAFENSEAKGRYICCHSKSVFTSEIAQILSKKFTDFPVTTKVVGEFPIVGQYDNEKLVKLLGKLIPLEQSLEDMVHSFLDLKIVEKK